MKKLQPRNCLACDAAFQPRDSGRKFCQQTCSNDYTYRQYIERWKSGEEAGYGGINNALSGHIKRYLIEKNGNACWKCGWCEVHPVTQKIPVQWNHIDGDSRNTREENLELICPNCHSLTPNFGALNKGKSTRQRRIGSWVDRHVANVN